MQVEATVFVGGTQPCHQHLNLITLLQILDGASVTAATAGAGPRQALALTIAHWQLATQCTPLFTHFTPAATSQPISSEARSLLQLAHMTSKAFARVHQPLPSQAMEAWQRAIWPCGSCELLAMGMTVAADATLQAFIAEHHQQPRLNTPASGVHPTVPGRLQQTVIAASHMLEGLAQAYGQFQAASIEADAAADMLSPDLGPAESQLHAARLQPTIVGAIATRGFQLSNGNAETALAVLVAAAVPAWCDTTARVSSAVNSPPWKSFAPVANGHARASSSRKRPRSASR